MVGRTPGPRRVVRILLVLAAALLAVSCESLQPAAPYDPEIEKTVSDFDKAVLGFIADMQGLSRTPKGMYGENVEFYKKWQTELDHLRNRAIANEVGESCGPGSDVDKVLKGGFKEVSQVLEEAAAKITAADAKTLEPARKWAEGKLKVARGRLDAATAAQADYDKIVAEVDNWVTATNRIAGAIAMASGGNPESFEPIKGGCTTQMVTYLADQFRALERFHMKQEDIGIPPRRAPAILISVPVQVILKVQERKKQLSGQGLL